MNPTERTIVCYTEGDITIETAENDGELVERLRSIAEWNREGKHGFAIDPGLDPGLKARFQKLGVGDLLH